MLPNPATLTDDQLRIHVENFARMFAFRAAEKLHPHATDAILEAITNRTWRNWQDTALDFLATAEAYRESRAAAPWN